MSLALTALIMLLPGGAAIAAPMPQDPPPVSDDACTLAAAPTRDALVSMPFRTVNGRIYLDVEVNGSGPFTFALDTGASGIGRADSSLVAELALPPAGQGETSDGVNTAEVEMVNIASLALGGLVRRDAVVITRDYRSRVSPEAAFSGILGREFFADGLLMIDFPARRIAFRRDQEMPAGQAGSLSYERAFRIPVMLGEMATTGNIDTGADVTLVIPGPLYRQLDDVPPTQAAGGGSLTNTRIASSSATIAGPVQIGRATLTQVDVRIAEEFPELLVGAHALKDHVVLIDQRHQTLAVCPPASQ